MSIDTIPVHQFHAGLMKVEIHASREAAGRAAAQSAAGAMRTLAEARESIAVIFATGASQFETLAALTGIDGLRWDNVRGFHMDEYIGISADHRASFRRYLRERLTGKVRMREFFEIDGSAANPEHIASEYAGRLRAADPQLCLLGIGENGHLAFNDPGVANFEDPLDAKIVELDQECRRQQLAEGWFPELDAVPASAITLTIPALMRVPKLIASVPGIRKAAVVARTLSDPISTACPATILRTHPDVTVFLDPDSASLIRDYVELEARS